MSFEMLSEVPDGTKCMTAKAVARLLDVRRQLIEGLVVAREIKGYKAVGRTGELVVLVDRDDLKRIRELIG